MADLKIHVPIINGSSGDQLCTLFQYRDVRFKGQFLSFTVESKWLRKHPDKAKIASEIYECYSENDTSRLLILEVDVLALAPIKAGGELWHITLSGSFLTVVFGATASYNPRTRQGMLYFGKVYKPNSTLVKPSDLKLPAILLPKI